MREDSTILNKPLFICTFHVRLQIVIIFFIFERRIKSCLEFNVLHTNSKEVKLICKVTIIVALIELMLQVKLHPEFYVLSKMSEGYLVK